MPMNLPDTSQEDGDDTAFAPDISPIIEAIRFPGSGLPVVDVTHSKVNEPIRSERVQLNFITVPPAAIVDRSSSQVVKFAVQKGVVEIGQRIIFLVGATSNDILLQVGGKVIESEDSTSGSLHMFDVSESGINRAGSSRTNHILIPVDGIVRSNEKDEFGNVTLGIDTAGWPSAPENQKILRLIIQNSIKF